MSGDKKNYKKEPNGNSKLEKQNILNKNVTGIEKKKMSLDGLTSRMKVTKKKGSEDEDKSIEIL